MREKNRHRIIGVDGHQGLGRMRVTVAAKPLTGFCTSGKDKAEHAPHTTVLLAW